MRVLLLNYEFPPCGSGAGLATQALAEGLAARGIAVDVVAGGSMASTDRQRFWDGEASNEGLLTVHRVRTGRTADHEAGTRGAASYLVEAFPLARRLLAAHRYDVAHFVFSLPTAAMLPALDLGGTPVVVSLRGSDVPGYDPGHRGVQRAHRALRPLTRWIWRRADRVIVPSESLGRLAQRTEAGLRYSVVPPGVDLTSFRPRSAARHRREDQIRCLAVARMVERNGLADLLAAMALLERGRYRLELVGIGPQEPALRETVQALGLEAQVRFSGWLDPAQVARRCRDADLFTLVPRVESSGQAFVEALAAGLPVVGSTAGAIPEIIVHGESGLLVPPGRPAGVAEAIRLLGSEPGLRAAIGRRNRIRAEAGHSWDRTTDRHLAIYRGVQRRVRTRRPVAELPSSSW